MAITTSGATFLYMFLFKLTLNCHVPFAGSLEASEISTETHCTVHICTRTVTYLTLNLLSLSKKIIKYVFMVNSLPAVINLYKLCVHLPFYIHPFFNLHCAMLATVYHQKEYLTRIIKFWHKGPHYTQGKSHLY